jgi:DNA-binding protein H-NS
MDNETPSTKPIDFGEPVTPLVHVPKPEYDIDLTPEEVQEALAQPVVVEQKEVFPTEEKEIAAVEAQEAAQLEELEKLQAEPLDEPVKEPELVQTASATIPEPKIKKHKLVVKQPKESKQVEHLKAEEIETRQRILEAEREERRSILDQIAAVMTKYRITNQELVEHLNIKVHRKGVPATQKFQDPITKVTWSGRGKEPRWIQGRDRELFRIAY